MFTNKDKRYGSDLTEEQLKEFENFIDKLEGEERFMLCEDCHSKCGCGKEHDVNLTDTGVCSVCGKFNDVVNCAVANKVENDNIPSMSYWSNGERIVKNKYSPYKSNIRKEVKYKKNLWKNALKNLKRVILNIKLKMRMRA